MAVATAPTPSPKELWEAYPLKPDNAERLATPSATSVRTAAAAAPTAAPEKHSGGGSTGIVIGGLAVLAFGGGIAVGRVRRRSSRPEEEPAAAAPAEERGERTDRFGRDNELAPAAHGTAVATAVAEPVAAPPPPPPPPPRPAESLRPARPRPAAALPPLIPPRVPWPDGSDAAWRCEIAWQSGYVRSEFRAMATPPHAKRRRAINASPQFKNLMKDAADVPRPELVSAVRDLAIALEAQGWKRVERGGRWYSLRFVWTRTEPPPGMEGAA